MATKVEQWTQYTRTCPECNLKHYVNFMSGSEHYVPKDTFELCDTCKDKQPKFIRSMSMSNKSLVRIEVGHNTFKLSIDDTEVSGHEFQLWQIIEMLKKAHEKEPLEPFGYGDSFEGHDPEKHGYKWFSPETGEMVQAFDTLINAIEKSRGINASNEQASTTDGTGTTQE